VERKNVYFEFLKVSRELGLPIKKILDMAFILKDGIPVENNKLLRQLGISRNVLNQAKKKLASFFEPSSKFTCLSPNHLNFLTEELGGSYLQEERIWKILETEDFSRIISLLGHFQNLREVPKREFDQFAATLETTALRACLMDFFGDIKSKRILFLGDDDFTSVAVASLKTANEISVLDIDERILKGIEKVSREVKFKINTVKYDARLPLPTSFTDKFDVVFTDPPYTSEGVSLFVSRAIQSLDQTNNSARIYICYGNSDRAKERFFPIYKVLTDSGLMMRWVFDKFNRYNGAESIGNSSSLFICDVTPRTKPLVGNKKFNGDIYTTN